MKEEKCFCQLDSRTDIFKAKEILRDHMCIMAMYRRRYCLLVRLRR